MFQGLLWVKEPPILDRATKQQEPYPLSLAKREICNERQHMLKMALFSLRDGLNGYMQASSVVIKSFNNWNPQSGSDSFTFLCKENIRTN